MQAELIKEIQSLFDRYAPEYILEEVKTELYRRGDKLGYDGYEKAANHVDFALLAFCEDLPGYRDEIQKLAGRPGFKPRW